MVIAVGGGVVTDLAGFAAACYLRGVAYVNVPTSLLAQVDAAIGGKTGRQPPRGQEPGRRLLAAAGGALRHRSARDPATARVVLGPRRDRQVRAASRTGTARARRSFHELPLEEQIARCAAIKAAVVAADEREGERRMILNYGHTLAHALEATRLRRSGGHRAPPR